MAPFTLRYVYMMYVMCTVMYVVRSRFNASWCNCTWNNFYEYPFHIAALTWHWTSTGPLAGKRTLPLLLLTGPRLGRMPGSLTIFMANFMVNHTILPVLQLATLTPNIGIHCSPKQQRMKTSFIFFTPRYRSSNITSDPVVTPVRASCASY